MWDRPYRLRHLFVLCALIVFFGFESNAQVRFVQITDPHLFDQGEEKENKGALAACVSRLNERIAEDGDYQFAVITGDIGIESLVSVG